MGITTCSQKVIHRYSMLEFNSHPRCQVQRRYPHSALMAAGWSLGANILVRYLGEEGSQTPIQCAVSMANPFNLVRPHSCFRGWSFSL